MNLDSSSPEVATSQPPDPENLRLEQDQRREKNWKRWGPYLAERQWGTVREDYSADGNAWEHFPHDHAPARAYRWGEDGLLGICDRQGRLCFALALWNGRDPILKERLFGLTGPEGNHGEDVKEAYFYLDSTPTHSYMSALYKYPQAEFPYAGLREESSRRGAQDPEYEIEDAGVFEEGRYFDVMVEYAKAAPEDVLIRITVTNRGPDPAPLTVLPTLWFRNTWSWGCRHEGCTVKPRMIPAGDHAVETWHETLGRHRLDADLEGNESSAVYTDNETNFERLYGTKNLTPWVKDAFHRLVIDGDTAAVRPGGPGTKVAFPRKFQLEPGEERILRFRLRALEEAEGVSPWDDFDQVFALRLTEADVFHATRAPEALDEDQRRILRQAYAGLLWSRQFYHYIVEDWLLGDPEQPTPPNERLAGRNHDWKHLFNRDVISMPDKWEYPWYAAWDLAFHMIPMARIDPHFAKHQMVLFLREWYMHPNGQIPAYEWALGDVNPPVHAWAVWQIYRMGAAEGEPDRMFLARCFQKLLINFTWWVNRKDPGGNHLFAGGFLGLDNIGVFDRSRPLPTGGSLTQADATAWMALYCGTMLSMALELAREEPSYEDVASKFFEHFVSIADAINQLGGSGLWDEESGFYYDQLKRNGNSMPLRIRSLVGILPMCAAEIVPESLIESLSGFHKRTTWFLENRSDLNSKITYLEPSGELGGKQRLLAIPTCEQLVRMLRRVLDEDEFLSPYGVRSLSKVHEAEPFVLSFDGNEHTVSYDPGESTTALFGGNSNWRGPVWFPINYLLVEALRRYHRFYGETLRVECPTGSGQHLTLGEVADELSARLTRLFTRDGHGHRPCHGGTPRFAEDPHWKNLLLFHEYFHGDTGKGLGASHQTGWTALVATLMERG